MASEISAAGYQDLRDYASSNWGYIELRNNSGSPILRLGISDNRVSWKHQSGAQELILEITLTGSDNDISTPVTIAGSAVFKAASGGSAMSEDTFAAVTLEDPLDKVTIQHKIQMPQIAQDHAIRLEQQPWA